MAFIKPIISILLVQFCFQLHAQQSWTLKECIDYAKEHNIQVLKSTNSIKSAEVDIKQAKAALHPNISFSTQQQLGWQKIESQSYSSYDSEAKNPTYSGSYGVQANMTLYNGCANWRTIKQQKINKEISELEYDEVANDIEVRIIESYFQILYAHESVAVNEAIVEVAQKELDRTIEKKNLGKSSKVEVSQMESQLEQNRYQLIQAKNTEATNILNLKQLLQLPSTSDFSIDYSVTETDQVMTPTVSLTEAQELALANMPDMKTSELKLKASELQVKIAKGGYQPKISLNTGISTSNGNNLAGSFGEQFRNHLRGSVGVSLSVPIYDQRSTRSSVDKAKIQLDNTQLEQENTKFDLENTIASLHLEIQLSQARYQSALANEKAAKEAFEVTDERYSVGLESLINLLNEKNNYIKAKQETLQSKYNVLLNQEVLNFYIGK